MSVYINSSLNGEQVTIVEIENGKSKVNNIQIREGKIIK